MTSNSNAFDASISRRAFVGAAMGAAATAGLALSGCGAYDAELASLFLGVDDSGYAGGRLEEYLAEEQLPDIEKIARAVRAAVLQIQRETGPWDLAHPFDYVLALKARPLLDC